MNLLRAVCFVCMYSWIACKVKSPVEEKKQLSKDQLFGHWIIQDAIRNNRPTQTINGAVFIIDSVQISHNIFGQDNQFLYQIADSSITTADQTIFNVEFLNDSLLMMNAYIQQYKFRFALKKQYHHESHQADSLSEM